MDQYPGMVYRFSPHHIIHRVCALQLAFPTECILIRKYNFSDAYRRVTHSARAVAQTILVIDQVTYLCLRLSYGSARSPPTFYRFSEMVTDLSNEILLMCKWNPRDLHSLFQASIPYPKYVEELVSVTSARLMAVNISTISLGRADAFIDNIVKVYLDCSE